MSGPLFPTGANKPGGAAGSIGDATGGGLFGTLATASSSSAGGIFGELAKSSASATTTAAATPLFGAVAKATGTAPLFGAPAATKSSSTPLFGAPAATTAGTAPLFGAVTKTASANGLLSGAGLFGTGATPVATSSVTPSAVTKISTVADVSTGGAKIGGLFGGTAVEVKETKDSPAALVPAIAQAITTATSKSDPKTAAAVGFNIETPPIAATAASSAVATAAAASPAAAPNKLFGTGEAAQSKTTNLFAAPATSQATTESTIATSASKLDPPLSGLMAGGDKMAANAEKDKELTYSMMMDQMDGWHKEMMHQQKEFIATAERIDKWDKHISNENRIITQMDKEVRLAEAEQDRFEKDLKRIEKEQKQIEAELQKELGNLEQRVAAGNYKSGKREETFQLAEEISRHLEVTCNDLKRMIIKLNASSERRYDEDEDEDPVAEIQKILGAHIDSLQWVDGQTELMQQSLEKLENGRR